MPRFSNSHQKLTIIVTSPWTGKLELTFAREENQSKLVHSYSQAPFKLQRPFYPEGKDVCHGVILHTAGGMTGGDRLLGKIELQPQSQALITTAAAAKIYRTRGEIAEQNIKIQLRESSSLEWFPQETIIFNGSIYQQKLEINLESGAIWFGWELLRFGRTARGEKFLAGDFCSDTEVWREGIPLWIEHQQLKGGEMIDSLQGLDKKPVIGTFLLIGKTIEPVIIKQIRQLGTFPNSEAKIGVTRLIEGLICRYQGDSVQECRRWFLEVWHLLRLLHLKRSANFPRVWLT